MIAAVTLARNEGDILEKNLRNMFDQGVDHIYAIDHRSTDNTLLILRSFDRVTVFQELGTTCYQPEWMNELAGEAHHQGAEWIIPFDADEFWFAPSTTLGEVLTFDQPWDKLYAARWNHLTWDLKFTHPENLPKVAYRWNPSAELLMGQHDVTNCGIGAHGVLEIRHWQYRSYEHFVSKVREWSEAMDPKARARGDGSHITQYEDYDEEQLREAYRVLTDVQTMMDPIPC